MLEVQQKGPNHLGIVIGCHLWERPIICLNVEVADRLGGVPPLEQFYPQLNARLALQVYESPIAPKVGHMVEVVGSHNHIPVSNIEGVGSVPPPLSQSLHQNGTSRLLR